MLQFSAAWEIKEWPKRRSLFQTSWLHWLCLRRDKVIDSARLQRVRSTLKHFENLYLNETGPHQARLPWSPAQMMEMPMLKSVSGFSKNYICKSSHREPPPAHHRVPTCSAAVVPMLIFLQTTLVRAALAAVPMNRVDPSSSSRALLRRTPTKRTPQFMGTAIIWAINPFERHVVLELQAENPPGGGRRH